MNAIDTIDNGKSYMALALQLAAQGLGRTSPNPPVGCVLVQGDKVVGQGFHPAAGQPHAEVFALREAGERARGATAYVTLEPCSHHGRTPPCADALIAAGVARVVVAAQDPNPQVAGQGLQRLRAAGLEVQLGVLERQALAQQAGFRSLVVRRCPWVVWKYAMSLDGYVGRADALSGGTAISGPQARRLVHHWRAQCDAVAVGSGTVLQDDPQLTTRLHPGRHAIPVVFDRRGRTPPKARVLRPDTLLVTGPTTPASWQGSIAEQQVIHADGLPQALHALAERQIASLLLEGGPTLAAAFLQEQLIDEVRIFVAPHWLGRGLHALNTDLALPALRDVEVLQVDTDALITGYLSDIPAL